MSVTIAPLQVGAAYYEPHNGTDSVGNLLYFSWNGGAPGTQLTDIVIDTHKDLTVPQNAAKSPVDGDMFFHIAPGGPVGTMAGVAPSIVEKSKIGTATIDVQNNSTLLTIHFTDFQPGGRLVLRVNVDELRTGGIADPIVEGAEFDGSHFTAIFTAPHYQVTTVGDVVFRDMYADLSATYGLNLPGDNYMPPSDVPEPVYTAGLGLSLQQKPLPITLSGTVFDDLNADNKQQVGDLGIAGVHLTLYELVGSEYTSTGKTAITDGAGGYKFDGLLPSTYRVVETQPDGYLSVGDTPGNVNGDIRGVVTTVDILSSINLDGGENSVHNDFSETKPASISGFVYVDANNDGVFDPLEDPIGGVKLTLLDANGTPTGLTTVTDKNGFYQFDGLMPGTYGVAETQPVGYIDGLDTAGSAGGVAHNPGDLINGIPLVSGTVAKNYDFGELLPASISGRVHAELNGDCIIQPGEPLLAGVTMYLLDSGGNRIASTTTDAEGKYAFGNLKPGVYGVEEIQPVGYLEGDDHVGSAGGLLDGVDRIINVNLGSGVNGVNYDFCELLSAKISGYVFQDGPVILVKQGDPPPDIPAVRDGKLTPDDKRLAGVVLQLCDGSGYPLLDSHGKPITTVTDANGYYEFTGLAPGVYSVVETQPSNYQPGIDTAGSNGGLVVNSYTVIDQGILDSLAVDPKGAAIVRITIDPGDAAVQYNFSVVRTETIPPDVPPPYFPPSQPTPLPPPPMQWPGGDFRSMGQAYYQAPQIVVLPFAGGSGGPGGYTWHLSIIDAGQPRHDGDGSEFAAYPQSVLFDPASWTGAELNQGQWVLADKDGVPIRRVRFGMPGAIPVTGDWDGSGCTKIGVFMEGLWFLDINGNSVWDEGDLWAKLGHRSDQPVTGDWDGDGKTDIGIFGTAWIGDTKAVEAEPGLPDPRNAPDGRQKNVPPNVADAAVGYRTMKRGQAGKMRSDVIDHVFQYGNKGDVAVTGDWTGDGISKIGIFRNGTWFLDIDGNGRWSAGDLMIEYGLEGDLPVVGDWTGDGISKIGIYRNGTFHLDTNNNREIDAYDKVFELGGAGDKPVVGDWTGDGVDKVGVYQDGAAPAPPQQAAK